MRSFARVFQSNSIPFIAGNLGLFESIGWIDAGNIRKPVELPKRKRSNLFRDISRFRMRPE